MQVSIPEDPLRTPAARFSQQIDLQGYAQWHLG